MSATRVPTVGAYRTPSHQYFMDGKGPYPGATGIIKMLDKSDVLVGWAKRVTAEFAVDNLEWVNETHRLVGRQPTVDAIKSKAKAEKDAGMELGRKIHYLIEDVGRGRNPNLEPAHIPYVNAYRRWLTEAGFELKSLEKMVFNETVGYAGTYDIIAKRDGTWWLIDAKTNKGSTYNGIYTGVYPETALQLAAYARAEFIAEEGKTKRTPLPPIERYAVLHLRPDAPYKKGYRLIEYSVTDADFDAFCACLALSKWRKQREPKVIGESVLINKEAA
jgi:hypothetical protein